MKIDENFPSSSRYLTFEMLTKVKALKIIYIVKCISQT